jgi:hypothetical protein
MSDGTGAVRGQQKKTMGKSWENCGREEISREGSAMVFYTRVCVTSRLDVVNLNIYIS